MSGQGASGHTIGGRRNVGCGRLNLITKAIKIEESYLDPWQSNGKLRNMKNQSFEALKSFAISNPECKEGNQTSSEDVSSEDGWLGFLFLGAKVTGEGPNARIGERHESLQVASVRGNKAEIHLRDASVQHRLRIELYVNSQYEEMNQVTELCFCMRNLPCEPEPPRNVFFIKHQFNFELVSVVINFVDYPIRGPKSRISWEYTNQMAPLPGKLILVVYAKLGQSQCFQSMRDRMHPPRMSAPSCIVPPTEQLVIRPHIVPLLPTFHGMESENPYAHIKEFEEVCNTFQEGGASIDLMRLKLFPFTLKDKAKIWLNSLRPRSIRTWTDLQAEFLKKFFPTHRTNGLKRQISNFSAKENEKFYECWERYMEAINACPHHGFDTWLLVSYFYDGMSSSMKQLLETMCGGDFMSKNPEEAMDFLSYVAEVSRGWDEPNKGEVGKMKSQPNASNAKAGMYTLNEDVDMKAKFAAMTRRLEELELKKMHEVQAVAETPVQIQQPCPICQSYEHLVEECPTIPAVKEMFGDQANVIGQFRPNTNAPYGITYNSSWRNHPNFSWKPRAPQYQQLAQPSQQASSLEQAIVNLSKVVGDFVGTKKP
ncbi:hypothetical protein CK203_051453 [Vitis vinifera]|uniref:Retrotransposon gag domain-containing protein n=1 Tax=Vitis vinifera TaxID=29760 RepID=A0A438H1S3_VITVI|nr:hypothetical protein CK203_051453 [Vitis vinifera]